MLCSFASTVFVSSGFAEKDLGTVRAVVRDLQDIKSLEASYHRRLACSKE